MPGDAASSINSTEVSYSSGVALVLLAGAFWSTMGIGIRSIEEANVWQILVYRSLALVMFLFAVISIRSGYKPFALIRNSGLAGVVGGLGLVVAFTGGIYSIQTTTVANAMFLFASAPFFAAILGKILLQESVRRGTWISSAIAIIGVAIMVADGFVLGRMVGNAAALVSALGFAVFTISLRWKKLEDMMPSVIMGGIFATIIALGVCTAKGYPLLLSSNDTMIALAMGVFQVGAGLTIYTIGARVIPAGELALLSMTEVLLGPFWVWLFLNEDVSGYTMIGGSVLLLAIAGNAISGSRKKPTPII